jgi:hypothetical protein
MDDLGIPNRKAEVLVLPVGTGEPAWLILLAGTFDNYAELTFAAIARVLTADLQGRELARIEHWQRRLSELPFSARTTSQRALTEILVQLLAETGADSGCVTSVNHGERRILAVSEPGLEEAFFSGNGDGVASHLCHLKVTLPMGQDAALRLDLIANRDFGQAAHPIAHTWLKALQPWISELGVRLCLRHLLGNEQGSAFEGRIQEEVERARRFGLDLGLVLIGRGPLPLAEGWSGYAAVAEAVRSELRACDVLGLLPSGHMGVLLLHSGREGAAVATARLAATLGSLPGLPRGLHMGRAALEREGTSAQLLIAGALAESSAIPPH